MTTHLILVSHGITQWNEEGRIQCHTDVPLNHNGRKMAECLAKKLSRETIHAIYTSDLKRAIQTADPTAQEKSLEIIKDIRLREGRSIYQERSNTYPTLPFSKEFETEVDLLLRMESVISRIARSHDNQTVLIVSHAGALGLFINKILDDTKNNLSRYRGIRTALNKIDYNAGVWHCISLNEAKFLN
ncbi:MAG: histidine phosphatase family protein [Desulfobacula sp.]|nr:histidine phosphatase family protein [Desulfobacula sp.]